MTAAGLYVFNTAVAGGEYVTVPNITLLSVTQASFELGRVGLEMGKQTPMFSDQVPPYHVISQRPEPGAVVRTGREVFPTVSQGAEIETTPEYVGKTLKEVESALAPGMRLGNKAWIQHSTPRDQIIAQDPPAGRALHANARLAVDPLALGVDEHAAGPVLVGPLPRARLSPTGNVAPRHADVVGIENVVLDVFSPRWRADLRECRAAG